MSSVEPRRIRWCSEAELGGTPVCEWGDNAVSVTVETFIVLRGSLEEEKNTDAFWISANLFRCYQIACVSRTFCRYSSLIHPYIVTWSRLASEVDSAFFASPVVSSHSVFRNRLFLCVYV